MNAVSPSGITTPGCAVDLIDRVGVEETVLVGEGREQRRTSVGRVVHPERLDRQQRRCCPLRGANRLGAADQCFDLRLAFGDRRRTCGLVRAFGFSNRLGCRVIGEATLDDRFGCGVVGTAPLDDRHGPGDERHDQGQSGAGEENAEPPGRPAGVDDGDVSQVTSRFEEFTFLGGNDPPGVDGFECGLQPALPGRARPGRCHWPARRACSLSGGGAVPTTDDPRRSNRRGAAIA